MLTSKLLPYILIASEAGHKAAEHGAGHGEHGGRPELPHLFLLLKSIFPHAGWAEWLEHYHPVVFSFIVIIILSIVAYRSASKRAMIPSGLQNAAEWIVEGLRDFLMGILGPQGKKFIPFLGTLFIYIYAMNVFALIPGGFSPTSNLNTTLGMAIVVFFYVQYTGMRKNGILGYLHHMAGSPKSAVEWFLVPLFLPLHIIGELAKPVSLSLRLFGNISGEDVLLAVFVVLGISLLNFLPVPVGLPLHLPFIFLALLLSFVQALVFTLLSTIYFALMFPHDEEH
ncbi:MAG: F0F1 ATP synthase subunit A [candidate division Zixibacteria bacterium]|nr:F0F1 ATP synthase subunit A [candidate division Zixibacteria bacterium]